MSNERDIEVVPEVWIIESAIKKLLSSKEWKTLLEDIVEEEL